MYWECLPNYCWTLMSSGLICCMVQDEEMVKLSEAEGEDGWSYHLFMMVTLHDCNFHSVQIIAPKKKSFIFSTPSSSSQSNSKLVCLWIAILYSFDFICLTGGVCIQCGWGWYSTTAWATSCSSVSCLILHGTLPSSPALVTQASTFRCTFTSTFPHTFHISHCISLTLHSVFHT